MADNLDLTSISSEHVLEEMSRIALETATVALARQAREFARALPDGVTGSDALESFARAIERTNVKAFGGKLSS